MDRAAVVETDAVRRSPSSTGDKIVTSACSDRAVVEDALAEGGLAVVPGCANYGVVPLTGGERSLCS